MTDTDNIPQRPQDIVLTVPQTPGVDVGHVGVAGVGQPGPNYFVVAQPRVYFVLEEIGYFFLKSWLGLTSTEALLAILQATTGAGDAWTSLKSLLLRVTVLSLGATIFALGWRLLTSWSDNRKARGLPT